MAGRSGPQGGIAPCWDLASIAARPHTFKGAIMATDRNGDNNVERSADKQRQIQAEQDQKDAAKKGGSSNSGSQGAAQTGAREHPEPPLPKQHQGKPGHEHELEPAPQ